MVSEVKSKPSQSLIDAAAKELELAELVLFLDGNDELKLINGIPFLNDVEFPKIENEIELSNIQKVEAANAFKRLKYVDFLKGHFENFLILSGAGTSVTSGGLTISDLWDEVLVKFGKVLFIELAQKVMYNEENNYEPENDKQKDLELLLSKALIAKEFLKHDALLLKQISDIQQLIWEKCSLSLNTDSPHEQFISKITSRKLREPRVKIFNLNYDTLFEEAATKKNFIVIDGFSFSHPRTFSGRNFDFDLVYREKTRIKEEESYVPNVFHHYKMHGSFNWKRDNGNVVIAEQADQPLIILPNSTKYESSYEQPYFEMMSRFQQNLRQNNVLLITIGFSFNDKHIVSAIKEAILQNPSFRLMVVDFRVSLNRNLNMDWLIKEGKKHNNIMLVSESFEDFSKNFPYSPVYADSYNFQQDNIKGI